MTLTLLCLIALAAPPDHRVVLGSEDGAPLTLKDLGTTLARITRDGGEVHAVSLDGPRVRLDLSLPKLERLSRLIRVARLGFHPILALPAPTAPGLAPTTLGWSGPSPEALRAALAALPMTASAQIAFAKQPQGGAKAEAYLLGAPILSNVDVAESKLASNPHHGGQEIALTFKPEGAKRFSEHTAAHVGRGLAIVVDGEVLSAPIIRERISGGRAIISMGWVEGKREAARLAEDLKRVALERPLQLISVEALR